MTVEEELLHRIEALEKRVAKRSYSLAIVVVTMFLLTGVNIVYTTIAVTKNTHVWCDLVGPLDDQYKATPPPTTSGKVFAKGIHEVRVQYHCK
jgi:hypothetical protein